MGLHPIAQGKRQRRPGYFGKGIPALTGQHPKVPFEKRHSCRAASAAFCAQTPCLSDILIILEQWPTTPLKKPNETPWTKSALHCGICRSYTARRISPTIAACGSIILCAKNMKTCILALIALVPFSVYAEKPIDQPIREQLQKLNERIEAIEKKLDYQPTTTNARKDPERKVFGMTLIRGPKGNRVSSIIIDSPADKAGVRPGDLIVKVDEENVTALSSSELLRKLESKDVFSFTLLPKKGDEKKVEMEKKRQGDFSTETGGYRQVGGRSSLLELEIGDFAPDFSATSQDGKQISLHEFKDKVVLINFTATWSQLCKKEYPELLRFYKENKDKGFEIVSVFLDNNTSDVERYAKDNQIPWPVFAGNKGWDNEIARQYGISGIPTNPLVVDGKIVEDNVREPYIDLMLKKYLN